MHMHICKYTCTIACFVLSIFSCEYRCINRHECQITVKDREKEEIDLYGKAGGNVMLFVLQLKTCQNELLGIIFMYVTGIYCYIWYNERVTTVEIE